MPKMKTKKAAAKRFSFTATGKVKYKKMNLRHILTKKSAKRKMIFAMQVSFLRIQQKLSAASCFRTVINFKGYKE